MEKAKNHTYNCIHIVWDIKQQATNKQIRQTKTQTLKTLWWLPEGKSVRGELVKCGGSQIYGDRKGSDFG